MLIGAVNIRQVPHLYEQSNVMFLPTLLECFSASYTEAMRMQVPILTTDLGFAHSICAEAACYFQPTSASDLGEKIVRLASDRAYCRQLTEAGTRRLLLRHRRREGTETHRDHSLAGWRETE